MRAKSKLLSVLVPLVLATSACKKDGEVQETLDLLDKHGKEMAGKVKSASDKKAGVADAQKYLDSNKDDMTKRLKDLGELRGFQVSEEMQTKMASGIVDAMFACTTIQTDLIGETMSDDDLDKALDKLCKDWEGIVSSAGG